MARPNNRPASDFHLRSTDLAHLEKMDTKRVTMLQLRHDAGKSYEQIAAAMNLSVGTVKSGLHRARTLLLKLRTEAAA